MSQYETKINHRGQDYLVRIGWDHPLMTYFGQIKPLPETDDLLVWVGTHAYELFEPDALIEAMPQFTHKFIAEHSVPLYGDKDEGR